MYRYLMYSFVCAFVKIYKYIWLRVYEAPLDTGDQKVHLRRRMLIVILFIYLLLVNRFLSLIQSLFDQKQIMDQN